MSSKPREVFPTLPQSPRHGKSRRIPAAFSMIWGAGSARSEPLAAAVAVPIRAAIVAVHAALEPAVPPAFCAKLAAVMGQQRKPALLAVVERLVERVSRIRDLLQRRGRGRHIVGPLAQPRHRIIHLLLIGLVILRLHPRVGAIDPQ